jgi:hypothetical protein
MKTFGLLAVLFLALIFMVGCAAGPNPAAHTPVSGGSIAGFWLGLWHGLIAPITFIISLFSNNVHFYEVHNNGGWYNFGFLLGFSSSIGGGSKASN